MRGASHFSFIAAALTIGAAINTSPINASDADNLAREIMEATGIKGGVVVHLGCDDGTLTAALRVYPHDEESESNVIEVLVARLRKKLDPGATLHPIETLRGRGYRFVLGDG